MSITLTNKSISIKVAAAVVGVLIVSGLLFAFAAPQAHAALTESQIQSILSLLSSFGADQGTINNVNSSLRGLPTSGTPSSSAACTFTRSLTIGSSGADVTCLQTYLESMGHFTFAGAKGYFGSITQAAVAKWQAANGVSPAAGYFGPLSQAKYSAVVATTPTTPGPTTPAPTGTGLTVSAGVQPANTLAVFNAARVPFTRFIVTAGNDGDVVMNSVTVQRTGLAVDANFSGLVLLDEGGMQLGVEKTLNSNHQSTLGEAVTIPRGTSKTFTVAANMSTAANVNGGEIGSFDVVAVNTSAVVSGSFPIKGATHTMNDTLVIGTITEVGGPLDPGAAATKEVGTKGYTFSSIKVTAGSQEQVRLASIRWNQASSTGSSDLANVMTIVDGTSYPTTVSADGKYYSTVFPGGLLIDKGLSKEISVKGDIVSGSGRTVAFTIEKSTDLYITGETYQYGITPSTSSDTARITSGSIFFNAYTVTVSGGSLVFTQNTGVASQNIAVNLANQPLAGFKVKVEGEPISVQQIVFDIATTGGSGNWTAITNMTIVDENGSVVSGPKDAAALGTSVTFTDAITFPIGEHTYTVKGKLGSTVPSDATVRLTTNPASDWSTVKGQSTNNTITPSPSGDQALQTMTAKAASVTVSVSTNPPSQTVVEGVQNFIFANYQLDATASGEDVRFNTLPLDYNTADTATNLTNCMLYDGSTALNTGSNVVQPSATASSTVFTFDTGLIVPKGTVKTLALKCSISTAGAAGDTYLWGYATGAAGTGQTSGQSATIVGNASVGQTMTIATGGTLTVALDASSPSYALVAGGQTGVSLSVLKFISSNEEIKLNKIALQLTNTASSSAADLTTVTVWDGGTQVGSAVFAGSSLFATSTLTSTVTVPKDGVKILTVKGDIADIGTSQPGTEGHLVAVDYDNDDPTGTSGTGSASGSTIDRTSSADTGSEGVRMFNTYPTFAKLTLPTNTLSNGTKDFLRWSVTANQMSPVGIAKFTLTMSSTTAAVTTMDIFCFTDSSFATPCSGLSTDGGFLVTDKNLQTLNGGVDSTTALEFWPETSAAASTTIQVPAAGSRYFVARGTVTGSATGASVSFQLEGDSTFPTVFGNTNLRFVGFASDAGAINTDAHNDFIWSPNSTTSAGLGTEEDWTNGYGVLGLPGSNMTAETLSP
ncbi:hypothetical protein A2761_00335 [Candidatus Kaiserbacteria bacterium RIFCSPHIGHO2_01_FULL_51_33]|uniref:Peptidoglycan binding-like domain-containing protein n=1 Tax=Candidatus Kaiserbacteria bacterium RIFCSPLOWO2_01_FULL_51_21 TaxID=1798508 RepID=A0A1F6ECN0_9BACT|nr:MAG: hypothetical protein A2761_00335 [Candidatus Kaiserbacteria bacterium RIFCSPHIGHO2_01_FULL_51_33]OGG71350.1 MAG: hypothetical protein A3A35_00065 [Candidatus Kaiserbacteria bacterium RIFCSPLOWO2_01_FULL_51_21]